MEFFMHYLSAGGTMVVWGLAFCSVLVLAVSLERLYLFFQASVDSEWLLKQMAAFVSENSMNEAIRFCENRKWLLADIFKTALYRADCTREAILDAMLVKISNSARLLEANLSILGTIAVIAPFVGLFGTVLGIIQAFNEIAKHGKTGIETVGAGVAEALVATAAGLFVAIFAVIAFNYFKSRIKRMTGEMSDYSARLGELLYFKQSGIPFPPDSGIKVSRNAP